jgi:hypothetical protein
VKVEIIHDDVVWEDLEGEIVILNLATGMYYGIEGQGNDMWRLLAEHGSPERVVETLAAEYDIDRDELAHDVDRLIRGLADRRLVKIIE